MTLPGLAMLAAVMLLAATPALAWRPAEFCDALQELTEAAPGRFRDIATTQATYSVDGERRYISLRYLPDTKVCTITQDVNPVLECRFFTGILPVAEELYGKLVRQIVDCMSPDRRYRIRPDLESTDATTFTAENLTRITIDKSHVFGEEVLVRFEPGREE